MFTLITGAGSGIGRALAMECASRKMNVLLVSLPDKEFENTLKEIKEKYSVECHGLGADLSKPESFCAVYKWIKENNFHLLSCIINTKIS